MLFQHNRVVRYDGLWRAILAFAGVALLAVALGLTGCGKPRLTSVEISPGRYEIPAKPAEDREDIAGKPEADRLATFTVHPTDKPVVVRIYKKKVSLVRRLLTNDPEVAIVADTTAVTVETPKKSLAWRWGLLIGILAALVLYTWQRLTGSRGRLLLAAWRLLTRAFKRP